MKDRAGWRIKEKNESCIFSFLDVLLLVGMTKVNKRDGNGDGRFMWGISYIAIIVMVSIEKECAVDLLIESINRFSD